MTKVADRQPKTKKTIKGRVNWPEDVHAKICGHQRKLSAKLDRFVTFEEATIDFIENGSYAY